MTTPTVTSSTDSQMHNNIMAAGSRDRPPMLVVGRYPQWHSQFLRYIDTRPNGEALRKCILSDKTPMNMSPENKAHFEAKKEAIHLILIGIGDEIYSTVDACQTAQEIWEAIERLQQGLARNANPLALVATAQADQDPYYQTSRVKDSAYHKEKMLLYKQAEQGVPLKAKHYDWLANTAKEVDEQELEAHYSYMAKIQEVLTAETGFNSRLVEQNKQNDVESDDERVTLANLKLDVDEYKKIQKQLKKASTTLAQELKECKAILAETSKSLRESISVQDSCLVALQNKQTKFEKYKAFNDRTIDYDKLERRLNETLGQLAQKDIEIKEGLKTKAYELLVFKEKRDELMKQSLLTKSHYEGLVKHKTKVITDLKRKEEHEIKKMLSMEKQLKFLNEVVYKRSQSIQTIHMMASKIVQLILFIVDSGCTKHMTGNLKLLCNFVEIFLGTVRFGNDQFAPILGYGDLVQGNVTINRVYYVECLNHILFSVGQFCDADLEVAFRKSTCFVRDLQGNDLLIGVAVGVNLRSSKDISLSFST
nr:integrase, catalytic region, zinc finger, CCHC-type, peptidase aspartic, catalytic [Tanacetum cinerariifolium]